MNTTSPSHCPRCGSPLEASAVAGLCPKCLMARAAMVTEAGTIPAPATPAPSLEDITSAFPELEVIELIGRGGMGMVYKARQKSLNRLVALKLLAPERVKEAQFAERFEKEAQALAALSHPNIVTVHDFGKTSAVSDSRPPFYFLLMEFVDGVNLRQAMQAGRFTPEQALAIVPPVCAALQYAHEHGIVHRDIKPENLLLDKEGRVKIADFGIAKMLHADVSDTVSQPVGTPRYMAPEQQSDPQRVDHRADIYSLGVVLFELLTGELPGSIWQPPSQRIQIDVRLDEVVLRALHIRPEMRWQTAMEMQTQVEAATAPSTPSAEEAAARDWLAIMDRGNYEQSWSSAHPQFLAAVTKEVWSEKSRKIRAPLGAVVTRRAQSTNQPSKGGAVAVVKFDTAFDGLNPAVETVSLAKDPAEAWKVTGYLIKPASSKGGSPASVAVAGGSFYRFMGYEVPWSRRLFKLSWAACLCYLGFIPGLEFMRVFAACFLFLVAARLVQRAHHYRAGTVADRRPWCQRLLAAGVLATLIVIPVLAWVVQLFVITGKSLEPEMPPGSRILVWKLTHTYVPGDIIAHWHGKQVWVSRVLRVNGEGQVVQRNRWPEESLSPGLVLGKVISVYWRAPGLPASTMQGTEGGAKPGPVAEYLQSLKTNLAQLSEARGPRHPAVLALQQKIDAFQAQINEPPAVEEAQNTSERLRAAKVRALAFSPDSTDFKPGDSITLDLVEGTSPKLEKGDIVAVKGHWQLTSAAEANLGLYVTSYGGGGAGNVLPEQIQRISKGSGTFELRCGINYTGQLHVSFYPTGGGDSFGGIYFSGINQQKPAQAREPGHAYLNNKPFDDFKILYLRWQPGDHEPEPDAIDVWHMDGTEARPDEKVALQRLKGEFCRLDCSGERGVGPGARYLQFALYDPAIDGLSEAEISLSDSTGERIAPGNDDSTSHHIDNTGDEWMTAAKCLGHDLPEKGEVRVTVKLSAGAWQRGTIIKTTFLGSMGLADGVFLAGMGDLPNGHAFFGIMGSQSTFNKHQWTAMPTGKDGSEIHFFGSQKGGPADLMRVEVQFDAGIRDIESFTPMNRPVKTFVFENVKLPPLPDAK